MKTRQPPVPAAPSPVDEHVDERLSRVRQRPDGFHWIDVQGRQEFGPFDTLEEALADMDQPDDSALDDAEQVDLAEQDLDIADRINSDRGDAGGLED